MRKKISETIFEEEKKNELSPLLRYSYDFLLSPEEWKELICVEDSDYMAIDLPFVQLTAYQLKRNIILLPILQKDIEDEISVEEKQKDVDNNKSDLEKEKDAKMFLIVSGDETNQKPPFAMFYFPEGQFGPDAHFQGIDVKYIDKTVLKNKANYKQALDASKRQEEDDEKLECNEDEDHNDDFNAPQFTAKGNSFNQTTMLTPQDPAATIILNETGETQKKKLKRGNDAPVYTIAPGEGKKPEEWLREPTFDIEAFPHLFPDGKYGLHYDERPKKITPAKYFPQRILNQNNAYAKDSDYIFMAQQYLERFALERQIDMSMLHGSFVTTETNQLKLIPSDDKFSIFQSIPGTPAYWKKFRNEVKLYTEIKP